MQNKQEILENAYEALENTIKLCNELSKKEAIVFKGDKYNDRQVCAETAYYLSQVIKVLENK